jgi:hypothetical protein
VLCDARVVGPPRAQRLRRAARRFLLLGARLCTHSLRAREWLSRSLSRPIHPAWLRCCSVTYQQYAPSSRLASRAPGPPSSTDLAIRGPFGVKVDGGLIGAIDLRECGKKAPACRQASFLEKAQLLVGWGASRTGAIAPSSARLLRSLLSFGVCGVLQCVAGPSAWAAQPASAQSTQQVEATDAAQPSPRPAIAVPEPPAGAAPVSAAAPGDLATARQRKQADSDSEDRDYYQRRYEPAGFPLLGGDSDIGFEFGVVGTLSKFGEGAVPYQWNMDLVLALSVKNGPTGREITQQSYQWNIDVPNQFNGHVRLNPQVLYYRTVNQLYYGRGNASPATPPAGAAPRYFEFDDRQLRARELTRVALRGPVDAMIGTQYRYEDPHPYDGSLLQAAAASGAARGVEPLSLFTLAAGFVYDTRDNEIFPRRGSYDDMGLRATVGFPSGAGVRYGGAGARIAKYIPLGSGPAILALRGVADLEFGNVPVYDLYTGGVFLTDEMIGGSSAVRGVPDGRYSGLIKVFGNSELRALLLHVRLLGQQFAFGGNLLFDVGRLWTDYTFHNRVDGSGIGLKWGAGGGGYLQWGQAAVFRIELAYSPDAKSENPGFPVGIYVEDGVMF